MSAPRGAAAPGALLAWGRVRHERFAPRHHAFAYPLPFLLLPMRSLRERPCAALARNRRALFAFHDRDHGAGGADALAWLDAQLAAAGVHDADGEVWLQRAIARAGEAEALTAFAQLAVSVESRARISSAAARALRHHHVAPAAQVAFDHVDLAIGRLSLRRASHERRRFRAIHDVRGLAVGAQQPECWPGLGILWGKFSADLDRSIGEVETGPLDAA